MLKTALRSALILLLIGLASCTKAPLDGGSDVSTTGNHADNQANQWIYKIMKSKYLWNAKITSSPDFNQDYDTFYHSLLNVPYSYGPGDPHDGTYSNGRFSPFSFISRNFKSKSASRADAGTYSLGIEFRMSKFETYGNTLFAQIIYVYPDSPADKLGVRRGQWIRKINGREYTESELTQFYSLLSSSQSTKSLSIELCELGVIDSKYNMKSLKSVSVSADIVDQNPVFLVGKLELPNGGANVGYLMYNAFESGPSGNFSDKKYINSLKSAFVTLKDNNVTELVLDLRYNGGGFVAIATLLASMIVGQDLDNQTFAELRYVDRDGSFERILSEGQMSSADLGFTGGVHLGLNRVYILTTEHTASASELVIYGLKGMGVDVTVIGEVTTGKNVGSVLYNTQSTAQTALSGGDFGDYSYNVQPIVSQVFDRNGKSDYAKGIVPNANIHDFQQFVFAGEDMQLGNPKELLLSKALSLIAGNVPATASTTQSEQELIRSRAAAMGGVKYLGSSLDDKPYNGVIALPEPEAQQ